MAKVIKLKSREGFRTYDGYFTYLVIPNHHAGRKNVYDVLVRCPSDPVTIGRELDLPIVRSVILDWEVIGKKAVPDYIGDQGQVRAALAAVSAVRRARLQKDWKLKSKALKHR